MAVRISSLLYTEEAKNVYAEIKGHFHATDLARYKYAVAAYCNEVALYNRLSREIAEADTLVVEAVNNKCKTYEKRSELVALQRETFDKVYKLTKELGLSPKSSRQQSAGISIELPE